MAGVVRAKGAKGKCDVLFSKIIRADGFCQRCGSTSYTQCAHIISRRYSATRTDLRNAWCLCAGCHRRLTDWPVEHTAYAWETIGEELYQELQDLAEGFMGKFDWDEELIRLKQIAKERGVT